MKRVAVAGSLPRARYIRLDGQRFGRLTVLGEGGRASDSQTLWRCVCDCGVEKLVRGQALRGGSTTSCGCYGREAVTTHGMTESPTYKSWTYMVKRCRNKNASQYAYYGGRGIDVCERWLSFENFYADMGDRPPGCTLDRIDVNGHYEPGNCRWSGWSEQMRNKRTNRRVTIDGVTRTVVEWAEVSGLSPKLIYGRLYHGKSGRDLLAPPRRWP